MKHIGISMIAAALLCGVSLAAGAAPEIDGGLLAKLTAPAIPSGNEASLSADVLSIGTAEELAAFLKSEDYESAYSWRNVELTADIDLSDYCSEDEPLSPLPDFYGTFDGKGHTVSGLCIGSDEDGKSALFMLLTDNAVLKNVTFRGTEYGDIAGGIVYASNGVIENVTNGMTVLGKTAASGIVYLNYAGTVKDCVNRGDILADGETKLAGIAMQNYHGGNITGCVNYGVIGGSGQSGTAAGICCNSDGSTLIGCKNFGSVKGSDYTAGIAVYFTDESDDYFEYNDNYADISGFADGVAGVVCFMDGNMRYCRNYGKISNTESNTAGIAVTASKNALNCENHGDISGHYYTAGIVSNAGSNMWCDADSLTDAYLCGCVNYASVSGDVYTSGIVSFLHGDIENTVNYGAVTGLHHRTAGVVANFDGGSASKCANHGAITGNTGDILATVGFNFTGGVIAWMNPYYEDEGKTISAKYLYNTAPVSSARTGTVCGGIIGLAAGDITSAFDCDEDTNFAIQGKDHATVSFADISRMAWGYDTEYTAAFPTGKLAFYLNTDDGSVANRLVWSQGDGHPVFADDTHAPVHRYSVTIGGETVYFYNGADGKADAPNGLTGEQLESGVCFDEDGNEHKLADILRSDTPAPGETRTVRTADEFLAAVADETCTAIITANDISLDGDVTVGNAKVIYGGGNRLTFIDGGFLVNAALTLDDIVIYTEGAPVTLSENAVLTISGITVVRHAVSVGDGSIVLDAALVNLGEAAGEPLFTANDPSHITGGEKLYRDGDKYYSFTSAENTVSFDLVAAADANNGLPYDIYPSFIGDTAYFFLPCTADLTDLTFYVISDTASRLRAFEHIDMTGDETPTVVIKGTAYKVTAMQSELPTLSFDIDESFGTIEAMNASPDHEIKCFGDVRLDVTPALTETKGWTGFVSKEGDEKKNGTMEIKGRGNSTWDPTPGAKKPYQFKLESKVDVLGMGKSKTWLIIKNDEHIVKNKLGLDLAKDIGLDYSGNSEFVDVFMNGRYLGNYMLCEKVEVGSTRVDVTDLDDAFGDNDDSVEGLDMTGGYLLEIDNWGGDPLQVRHAPTGTVVSVKSPEDLDEVITADNAYGYIYYYVNSFLDAVYGDGYMADGRHFLDAIDRTSFTRYFFHQEYLCNGDCGRGSTYLYKDRDSIDPLLYAGPIWDNDRIFETPDVVEGWYLDESVAVETGCATLYNQLMHREDFAALLLDAYQNDPVIREALANAYTHIDEYVADLGNSAEMNRIRWGLPTFDISWLKEYLAERFAWIDENIGTLDDLADIRDDSFGFAINGDELTVTVTKTAACADACDIVLAQYDDEHRLLSCTVHSAAFVDDAAETIVETLAEGAVECRVMFLDPLDEAKPTAKMRIYRAPIADMD